MGDDERVRWAEKVDDLWKRRVQLVGDTFVSASFVAYCGAFGAPRRNELLRRWCSACEQSAVPIRSDFAIIDIMAEPVQVREWQMWGLPVDVFSTENALLATRSARWPLCIDPQAQANRWIRRMEADAPTLLVVRPHDVGLLRALEAAVRAGGVLLLEDIGETLDVRLDSALHKRTSRQAAGRTLLRVGDADVDYDEHFKMYITTKLPNPHYLPEVSISVTLIDFTVTLEGLTDQLLGLVVHLVDDYEGPPPKFSTHVANRPALAKGGSGHVQSSRVDHGYKEFRRAGHRRWCARSVPTSSGRSSISW